MWIQCALPAVRNYRLKLRLDLSLTRFPLLPPLLPGVQGAAPRKGKRLAGCPLETADGWECPHCGGALDIEALLAVLEHRARKRF